MSGWRATNEGDGLLWMLAVVAQAGSNGPDPGAVEQAEGGIAQQRQHRRPLAQMHQAGVFAQGHVFGSMQPVLDGPVATLQLEQPFSRAGLGGRLVPP